MVKLAAKKIGGYIRDIVNRALRIIAEGSVPVAGWVIAAAEIALLVDKIIILIRDIYKVINFIIDAIESLVRAKAQMVEVADTMSNLVEAAARGIAARS